MNTSFTGQFTVAPLADGAIKCTGTQGGRCGLPAVVSGVTGHYYCAKCAPFCHQAMARLKVAQLRERHLAMASNHGGMNWGAGLQNQKSVDVSGEGSEMGAMAPAPEFYQVLSLLKGRSFADPDRLADDCNFDGLEDLAGCAIILKGCSFKLSEVEALLIEGMDMRFTLNSVLGLDDAFPFGVALPVGSFLDLLISPKAPSGLAMIETLFRSLIRHHPRGQVGSLMILRSM